MGVAVGFGMSGRRHEQAGGQSARLAPLPRQAAIHAAHEGASGDARVAVREG
jgi:hypothetical protein